MQALEISSAVVQYSLNPAPELGSIDPFWQLVFTSISGIAALGAIIYLIREAVVHRTLLPLMMIIGTTAALWFEPIVDMMAFLIYPHEGAWVAVESFGRKVPWVDTLAYYFYFPLPMWYFMKKFDARAPATFFWKSYAISVALRQGKQGSMMSRRKTCARSARGIPAGSPARQKNERCTSSSSGRKGRRNGWVAGSTDRGCMSSGRGVSSGLSTCRDGDALQIITLAVSSGPTPGRYLLIQAVLDLPHSRRTK